jgi:triosephosphate isomerase
MLAPKNKSLIVANWKMALPYAKTIELCTKHRNDFVALTDHATIICCPSTTAVAPVAQIFKGTPVAVGAQNCSAHTAGPYTGEESAQSLAQAGATHCLIGHSERRLQHGETSELVATKMIRALEQGIIPIICIGETYEEYSRNATLATLTAQLEPIFAALVTAKLDTTPLIIAYEPVWAIGTGKIPTHQELTHLFDWLVTTTKRPHTFLYGGSVTSSSITMLKTISTIDGFLVGTSSLDFQNFKNIVSLV